MLYYARIETLRTLRNKRYAIFVVVFPVALYLINSGIYGEQTAAGGVRQSVYLMVSMACYGALAAAMMSTALPWAQERASGWGDQLRVTPLPGWTVIAAMFGLSLAGGLWFPVEIMSGPLRAVAARVRRTGVLARRLRDAQGEVARLAAADERLRIARDLHDLLGHSLSVIVLKAELAGRLAEDVPEARREIGDIESVARKALAEVREAVAGYRQRSLAEEIDGAVAVLRAAGAEARTRLPGPPLPPRADALLAWAVREGVTNVVRHAGAAHCTIDVTYEEGTATLDIVDDGHGGARRDSGSGLAGLAERVRDAGGVLEAGPGPEGGFRLRVQVPAGAEDAGPNPPSARERDVLAAATDGATIGEIAGRLHLSEGTVRNYLSSAIQ